MTRDIVARENLRHIAGEYVLLGIKVVVHKNTGKTS